MECLHRNVRQYTTTMFVCTDCKQYVDLPKLEYQKAVSDNGIFWMRRQTVARIDDLY